MRVDPEVSRRKFHDETARLREQKSVLESRGIFVLGEPVFPYIELLFVPRHPLQVLVPAGPQSTTIILLQAPVMALVEVPSLAARAFKARFDLTDYDLEAPSLEFRDYWTDGEMQYPTMFRALEYETERKAHVVLLGDHPVTHKPFLCLRGIREYHEHPQHSGDEWLLYRKEMNLFSVVMSLWRVAVDLVHPQILFQAHGIQINWAAEEKV